MMSIRERFKTLPISAIADDVCNSLAHNPCLVVTAPPGAGKSTLLPLALLESIPKGKILMLEPRRIAARQVAERMADMLDEKTGNTVGYRVRFDTCISESTRIEVITEGILERMLIEDPTLEGVEAVIFDEFHERSLSSDLTLALTREIQNIIRPELRILVMSATIDADSICREMNAPHIHCAGKCYEVKIIHGDDFEFHDCAPAVAAAVRKASREHDGNILAFLPGQAEILKCLELLSDTIDGTEILTLYGMMTPEQQRKALMGGDGRIRRVVLASPIAETSLTIEGISVVVDSGLYRTPMFDPQTGLSRLATARISMDMATQRTGRAGRLSAGTCYRLWTKATEHRMKDCRQPEIEWTDLASMMLTTASWGENDPKQLPWITPPPQGHLANAKKLLITLGAINETGLLTAKGKRLAQLPCHPRIASMLTEAEGLKATACDIAALLEEKDPVHDDTDADLTTRIVMLRHHRKGKIPFGWKRIDSISAQYRRLVKASLHSEAPQPEEIGTLISLAYPERIAMRDIDGRYRMASGGSPVSLHPDDDLARHDFLAVASMGSRIFMAAPIGKETVQSMGKWMQTAKWDSREGKAVVREELRLGLLTLSTRQIKGDASLLIASTVAAAAPKEGLTMFDFNEEVLELQLRIQQAASWHHELALPDVSTETLLKEAGEWLPLYIGSATTVQDLRKIDIKKVILGKLDYSQQQALERIVPTHITLPSGRKARIHYRRGAETPIASARLQDCFGLMETPRIDEGRRAILMELLSPGFKPVQLTQDMKGFWRETYFEVRKELRRRYPKHRWPENPNDADVK
ncbi:MAG: ATP-dependent helicase HrpB [Muribaculaceae bacterium]|nr:ATP-dependent helicase HrpB [Muribaculaceae bacterium]